MKLRNNLNVINNRLIKCTINRLGEWNKKTKSLILLSTKTLALKIGTTLKMRGWKKVFQANGVRKQVGVAILISDKIDLRLKLIRSDKEGTFIVIKGTTTNMTLLS